MTTALAAPKLRVLDGGLAKSPPRRRAIATPKRIDTYNSHPATGLTAEMLLAMYRAAEQGAPLKQFDCFDDLVEIDGHLRGLINNRIEGVAGCDMRIQPGLPDKPSEIAAAALDDRVREMLPELVEHHLTAPHYGVAVSNTVWDFVEGVIAPIEFIHAAHRRFASPHPDRAHEIWLIGGETARDLVELEAGLWCVSRYRGRNPWSSGLLRTCGWWAMFKRWSIRDWQIFAEMFGLPLVIGFYEEGASEETRKALEEAVRAIGEDGFAVLSALAEIVIKETARSGDSSTVYPKIADMCEQQMSKVIAGSTTASDVGGSVGSYNLGSIHESRGYKFDRRDARRAGGMFSRDVGVPFIRWNGYDRAAPPRLNIQITRDSLERAKVLQTVGQVVPIDPSQIYDEFTLRVPADGKGVMFPSKSPGGGDEASK